MAVYRAFSVHMKTMDYNEKRIGRNYFVKCAILLLKRVIRRGLQSNMKSPKKKSQIRVDKSNLPRRYTREGYRVKTFRRDQVCIIDPANAFTEEQD